MMQQLQIRDEIATQLFELAEDNHISVSEMIEQLVKSYQADLARQTELKQFFSQYETDLNGFKFSREEANER